MSPSTQSLSSQPSTPSVDPYFNAPFFNDAEFKERPFKQRLVRFVKKHSSEGIFGAAKSHILSHLEYGSCLADYPALHSRYNRVRALEDVDDLQSIRKQQPNGAGPPLARVRFVNYYTISTGRPKKEKPTTPPADDTHTPPTQRSSLENDQLVAPGTDVLDPISRASTPAIQVDPPGDADKKIVLSAHGTPEANETPSEQTTPAPSSTDALGHFAEESQTSLGQVSSIQEEAELPAIPDAPPKPTPPDFSRYPDEDSRRQAEKEAKRELKAYEQAVKNRDKAVKERQKLLEKRRKRSEKERAKLDKEAEKQRTKEEKEKEKQRQKETPEPATTTEQQQPPALPPRDSSPADFDGPQTPGADYHHDLVPDHEAPALRSISPIPESDTEMPTLQAEAERVEASKPLKERKFCVVPRRPDPTWVSVFMRDMDEVGAHCGLFIAEAPHYDGLIGGFGQRIVSWVQEDMSKKAILRLAEETDDLGLD